MTHAGTVLAQDVRVGFSWGNAWDLGMPLLVAALATGVATVSGGTGV